jgi:prolyl-tRNA synthetase
MDGLADRIKSLLDEIQTSMLDRARQFREEHTSRTASYDEFKQIMEGRPGFVISPWCGSAQCEADIKAETQATIRNIPSGYDIAPGKPCIKCNGEATVSAWFAKAY